MSKNLEKALQSAAARLDKAIKQELEARKHIQSGRLAKSVKTGVRRGPRGYQLQTEMEGYGRKLNERSPFLDAAISSEEEIIHRMIEDSIHDDFTHLLDNEL